MAPIMTEAAFPADVDRLFAERINAGDVDGVVALYEPGAVLVALSGPPAIGPEQIRERFAALIEAELNIECNVVAVHESGDTAMLYNDWRSTRRGPCGERLASEGKALEVVRRQPGGTWRFVIDDPFARS